MSVPFNLTVNQKYTSCEYASLCHVWKAYSEEATGAGTRKALSSRRTNFLSDVGKKKKKGYKGAIVSICIVQTSRSKLTLYTSETYLHYIHTFKVGSKERLKEL